MLQEAVDALFDNGRRGRPVTGTGNRALKSLSDMLKGKQGRFRQNLLGKRVDYSGRSVIIVGPQLKLHQCGLPKQMALELFKPFVIKRLIDLGHAQNIKAAKRAVERMRPEVWDVLEEIIRERPVLLNRAPTLHRLGIQAFEPQLVEGKAIQLHPLVCAAFNADFDGDQMAVHLPLSVEAQAEARVLMLASNNILKPSDGRPVTLPSQDMIIGLHHLTTVKEGAGRGSRVRLGRRGDPREGRGHPRPAGQGPHPHPRSHLPRGRSARGLRAPRSRGRLARPGDLQRHAAQGLPVRSRAGRQGQAVADRQQARRGVPEGRGRGLARPHQGRRLLLGHALGCHRRAQRRLTPPNKGEIIAKYEKQAQKVQGQFEKGLVTDAERRQEQIKIWTEATDEVQAAMKANFPADNTINRMVSSGARGNWLQIRNIAGIRGLVNNTKGEIMPRPIISSYREGLSVAEYFTATHGARKGLADTALRTADSGYLTRRLVDVSQDVIIREDDCGTSKGLEFTIAAPGADGTLVRDANVENSVFARTLAAEVVAPSGEVVAEAGDDVGDVLIDKLVAAGVETIKVRSVLTCDSAVGVCAKCYGRSLATGKLVDIGEAVGIIAAQSIGEPGTQLTMRTFHTGGSRRPTTSPRVCPRAGAVRGAYPKGASPIAEADGRITIDETDKAKKVILTPDNGDEPHVYPVLKRATLLVEDGQHVTVGQPLQVGTLDPKEVMRVMGAREVQKYLVGGVQGVYRSQGVPIHDKHIEVIVRQMLRKVTVVDHGDTTLLPGELVDFKRYQQINREAVAEGKRPASGRPELMGITKASLATESWLSAASFQETTRVLTQAAMEGKSDPLVGLKENVIIGKLIPAGTGLAKYRNVTVEATEEAKSERYPNRIFASDGAYSDADLSYVDFDSFSTDDFTPGTYN
jgi:DNA-directed RNA polymerase subunit beta'